MESFEFESDLFESLVSLVGENRVFYTSSILPNFSLKGEITFKENVFIQKISLALFVSTITL